MDLTQQALRTVLTYNPNTGMFTRNTGGKSKVGSKANGGYIKMYVLGNEYRAHRLAWLYMTGNWPKDQLDHINGDPTDNRICNLREADNALNRRNQKLRKDNVSGVVGVSFDTRAGKWDARVAGKHLGYFTNFEDAVAARKTAAEADNFHPNHGQR